MTDLDGFERVLRSAARSLGKTFRAVGYLNGRQDAPMPERNAVVHLASAFLRKGFAVYAEPLLPPSARTGEKRRIDLLASRPGLSVAMELKTFGGLKLAAVLEDARRLEAYRPQAGSPGGPTYRARHQGIDPLAFWKESREKWGLIVIQSMMGEPFTRLWKRLLDAPGLEAALEQPWDLIRARKATKGPELVELASFLRARRAKVGSVRVFKEQEIWPNAASLELLWAAIRIA